VKKLIFIVLVLLTTGCNTQPIKDNLSSPISLGSYEKAEKAILQALAPLWRGHIQSKGHIIASRSMRNYLSFNASSHLAKVDIFFDAKSYTIKYKNSSNLKYDGENIHKTYNKWVIELNRAVESYVR